MVTSGLPVIALRPSRESSSRPPESETSPAAWRMHGQAYARIDRSWPVCLAYSIRSSGG